jgi:hypothetical protein
MTRKTYAIFSFESAVYGILFSALASQNKVNYKVNYKVNNGKIFHALLADYIY